MSAIVHLGDCLEVMRGMEANSVDLICTDPPYFKVKDDWWDRQWQNPTAFLAWLDTVLEEFGRILKPNGSLYVFASPQMSARVEVQMRERFNVLNRVRWMKTAGWHQKAEKEALRSFLSPHEEIIFAEHYGADNMAKGEAGYAAKCDELRGFIFEPLRAYLAADRDRAGWTTRRVAEAYQQKSGSRTVTGMAGHWFERVQWTLPTAENYEWLRGIFAGDYLRREYEELRREYEELRRPFGVSADVPFTDVWEFPTVQAYPGKHPCEKPLSLLEHIISVSSRPGAVVFDAFAGSGATGQAALKLGREFIGAEIDPHWQRRASRRIAHAQPALLGVS